MASLLFYSWGEPVYIFVMGISILVNWVLGFAVSRTGVRTASLVVALFFNLGMLVSFKYLGFIADNLNLFSASFFKIDAPQLEMPIGISFYTFQALSYVVDVYRGQVAHQRSITKLALYISFFPQLVAGPIVRYSDIAEQIDVRSSSRALFADGISRFVIGLSKKLIVANTAAAFADRIFESSVGELATGTAWLGIAAYTLQIYFDFSGYSDMAIGLGKMFGFQFNENFNLPYSARSIKDFWRRWHISLSSWFRDYLYIPLGGNPCGAFRSYLNLFIVFGLCGIWHGASWSFLVWGLFHGFFLVLERTRFGDWLQNFSGAIQSAYTVLVVMSGWVFFRANDLSTALNYLTKMFVLTQSGGSFLNKELVWDLLGSENILVLIVGTFWSLGSFQWLKQVLVIRTDALQPTWQLVVGRLRYSFSFGIVFCFFVVCLLKMITDTYNPFIYFRF